MKTGDLGRGGKNSGREWSCEGKAPAGVSEPGFCSQIHHRVAGESLGFSEVVTQTHEKGFAVAASPTSQDSCEI